MAMLENDSFDLVLMDVQMPEMDGLEATGKIRDPQSKVRDHHIPIIAMTAHAMTGDRERCLEAGMDGYVSKPVVAKKLFEAIDTVRADSLDIEEEARGEAPQGAGTATDSSRARLLARFDDLTELLEVAELFLEYREQMLADIRTAIAQDNCEAFERAAHSFKGAVSIFGHEPVFETALKLEMMGRNGESAHAQDVYDTLEKQAEDLKRVLEELAAES